MRPALIIILAVGLAASVIGHAAVADPPGARIDVTVRAVLPGCRSLVVTQGIPNSTEAAFCNGMIDALLYLGELLPPDYCYSVPLDIPRDRVVRAIVEEIEKIYPSIKEQHFRGLALKSCTTSGLAAMVSPIASIAVSLFGA